MDGQWELLEGDKNGRPAERPVAHPGHSTEPTLFSLACDLVRSQLEPRLDPPLDAPMGDCEECGGTGFLRSDLCWACDGSGQEVLNMDDLREQHYQNKLDERMGK